MSNILYCIALVCLLSCSSNKTTADLQKIYGQQMALPEGGQWRVQRRDTTVVLSEKHPKIVAYYNAQGCTSCRLKELLSWNGLIAEIRNLPADSDTTKVEFLFIFATGKDTHDLTIALQQYRFDYPVLLDTHKDFEAANLLPDKEQFHYFLLDSNYRVRLVGSPVNNPRMWQLYKTRIAEHSR